MGFVSIRVSMYATFVKQTGHTAYKVLAKWPGDYFYLLGKFFDALVQRSVLSK